MIERSFLRTEVTSGAVIKHSVFEAEIIYLNHNRPRVYDTSQNRSALWPPVILAGHFSHSVKDKWQIRRTFTCHWSHRHNGQSVVHVSPGREELENLRPPTSQWVTANKRQHQRLRERTKLFYEFSDI